MRTPSSILILSLLSGPALAQAAPAPAPAAAAGAVAPATPPAAAASSPSVVDKRAMARVEQHIKDLHDRLAITPAQEPQWAAFAAVMRQNAMAMEAQYRDRQSRLASLSAIDDMRNYAAMSRLHADNVDKLLPAFEALYSTMSPEQRTATDQTFRNFQRNTARPSRS